MVPIWHCQTPSTATRWCSPLMPALLMLLPSRGRKTIHMGTMVTATTKMRTTDSPLSMATTLTRKATPTHTLPCRRPCPVQPLLLAVPPPKHLGCTQMALYSDPCWQHGLQDVR